MGAMHEAPRSHVVHQKRDRARAPVIGNPPAGPHFNGIGGTMPRRVKTEKERLHPSQPYDIQETNMFNKIALAAALIAATSTVSLASEFDPNPANHSLAYSEPVGTAQTTQGTLRSAPASLGGGHSGRPAELDHDRASSPYAGGVG
jgi:hypothetical protein